MYHHQHPLIEAEVEQIQKLKISLLHNNSETEVASMAVSRVNSFIKNLMTTRSESAKKSDLDKSIFELKTIRDVLLRLESSTSEQKDLARDIDGVVSSMSYIMRSV